MCKSPSKRDSKNSSGTVGKTDIYRETALRYLGYASSLGWICRAFVPFQLASMVSVAYVCADIFDKANASANRGEKEEKILMQAADAFTWHVLATFAIPGALLHGVTSIASSMRSRRTQNRSRYFLLPCFLSGLALPLISKPIDVTVESIMNLHFRNRFDQWDDQMGRKRPGVSKCNEIDDDSKNSNSKFKWFYDQSRELTEKELERYYEKLREQKSKEESMSTSRYGAQQNITERPVATQTDVSAIPSQTPISGSDGQLNKAVQVDKTTKPPKQPPPEE